MAINHVLLQHYLHAVNLSAPEVVMEYAWKNGLMDFAMPFLIQFVADANSKLKEIDERTKPKDEGNDEMVNQQMMESQMYGQGMLAFQMQAWEWE